MTTLTSGLDAFSVSFADCDLRLADVVVLVQDLALQVRQVDDVEVDDADRADAREREVERDRRAKPARADDQHLRTQDLALTGRPNLLHDDVARVAVHLLRREHARFACVAPFSEPPAIAGIMATWSPSARAVWSPSSAPISWLFT